VTLTLAYARPIIASGADMLNTHFVFMNADFVLADGSLRSLANQILAGRSIVLGPSFRSTAEAVEPALLAAVDSATGTLCMQPRELVDLSIRHPIRPRWPRPSIWDFAFRSSQSIFLASG
jgi:hypothetical protein